jgi:Protein of unknown function (DUF3723)
MAKFQREKIEQYSHEARPSDGAVYRKILYYKNDEAVAESWKKRLTPSKRPSIGSILKREWLKAALACLEPFPGLWDKFELGNWRKHMALYFKEPITYYIKNNIYEVWNTIAQRNEVIRKAVDINTVRKLQLRAPSASKLDREYIYLNMDNETLFLSLKDRNLRIEVKRTLLNLGVMIPTIKSFHENMKYIDIGVKIIKRQLLNSKIDASLDPEDDGSLYETMRSRWSTPDQAMIEFREGEFRSINIGPEHLFRLCYMQLFCSALRNYTCLGNHSTRIGHSKQEIIHGSADPVYRLQFLKRAEILGFKHNHENDSRVGLNEKMKIPPHLPLDADGESIEYRCGRPYTKQYEQLRTRLFLPALSQVQEERDNLNPSVMFIARNFLDAFFGSNEAIWAAASCTEIRSETLMSSLQLHTLREVTQPDSPSDARFSPQVVNGEVSCELTQDQEQQLHETEPAKSYKNSSFRDPVHLKTVGLSDAHDSGDFNQLHFQSPEMRFAVKYNNLPSIPASAQLDAPSDPMLVSTEIDQSSSSQELTVSPQLPTQYHQRHCMCQLRRLGARGGAGKPTLLSLKN